MTGTYNPVLVALSILVGVLAYHAGLDFAERASAARGRVRAGWIAAGGAVTGLGLWSLHVLGMLALRLRWGLGFVPTQLAVPQMVLAAVVAVAAMTPALLAIHRPWHRARAVLVAGGLLGAAIVGTHYVAMAAMQVPARVTHDATLAAIAIVVAPVVATAALWFGAEIQAGINNPGRRLGTAIALGAAAAVTHYTAMAALRLTPARADVPDPTTVVPATPGVAAAVAAAILTLLTLATLAAGLDRRVRTELERGEEHARLYREAAAARREAEAERAAAEESERRFRTLADTAPVLIWMAGRDGRCTYVNRQWLEFTGRPMAEELGDGWFDGIHPDDRQSCVEHYQSHVRAREAFTLEYRLRRADGVYRWIFDTGVPRYPPHGGFAGFIGSCVDITARQEAEERQRFLLEAARVLASSLDLDAALRQVTGLFVPRLADYCLVYLRGPDGSYAQAAGAHADPTRAQLLEALGRVYRPDLANPHSAIGRVLRTGQPVASWAVAEEEVQRITADPDALRILRALGPRSYIAVPLIARGELLGAISLVISTPGRRFDESDLALIELLGARAGLALDNARLYTEARAAHEQAVRASQLETQLMQARLDALRAQLNPHFLFNALNTVAMLVRRGAKDDALRAVVSLSEVLRRALAGQSAQEVALREELALVEHYLQVEQLRFRDRLSVAVDVDPQTLEASVPGLVLQPVVENAIRHGVARRAASGRVEISARRQSDRLVLRVCDNGPGFPRGWEAAASGRVGLANTRERLDRLYGTGGRLDIRNAADGGAVVTVEIPFRMSRRGGSQTG